MSKVKDSGAERLTSRNPARTATPAVPAVPPAFILRHVELMEIVKKSGCHSHPDWKGSELYTLLRHHKLISRYEDLRVDHDAVVMMILKQEMALQELALADEQNEQLLPLTMANLEYALRGNITSMLESGELDEWVQNHFGACLCWGATMRRMTGQGYHTYSEKLTEFLFCPGSRVDVMPAIAAILRSMKSLIVNPDDTVEKIKEKARAITSSHETATFEFRGTMLHQIHLVRSYEQELLVVPPIADLLPVGAIFDLNILGLDVHGTPRFTRSKNTGGGDRTNRTKLEQITDFFAREDVGLQDPERVLSLHEGSSLLKFLFEHSTAETMRAFNEAHPEQVGKGITVHNEQGDNLVKGQMSFAMEVGDSELVIFFYTDQRYFLTVTDRIPTEFLSGDYPIKKYIHGVDPSMSLLKTTQQQTAQELRSHSWRHCPRIEALFEIIERDCGVKIETTDIEKHPHLFTNNISTVANGKRYVNRYTKEIMRGAIQSIRWLVESVDEPNQDIEALSARLEVLAMGFESPTTIAMEKGCRVQHTPPADKRQSVAPTSRGLGEVVNANKRQTTVRFDSGETQVYKAITMKRSFTMAETDDTASGTSPLIAELGSTLGTMWAQSQVQEAFSEKDKIYLNKGAEFFLDSAVDRIFKSGYVPTNDDMLLYERDRWQWAVHVQKSRFDAEIEDGWWRASDLLAHGIMSCAFDEDDPSPWLWCNLILQGSALNNSSGVYSGRKCLSADAAIARAKDSQAKQSNGQKSRGPKRTKKSRTKKAEQKRKKRRTA